jgi:inner membrane protein
MNTISHNENSHFPRYELNTVTKKVLIILGLSLILLIPLSQVENQIANRRSFEAIAQKEVAKGWGADVSFGFPTIKVSEKTFYPSSSETTIEIDSKEKKRGLFKVPVYVATMKSKVSFAPTGQKSGEQDSFTFLVEPTSAIQNFKIVDIKSGKELKAKLTADGIRVSSSELLDKNFFPSELQVEMSVRGTGELSYSSSSDQDNIKMTGNWPKPKFTESTLPTDSKLSSKGFEASWTLNALPKWQDTSRDGKFIGVTHLWVATDYSMIERAVKYGILFVALTFLLVFIVEFMGKLKIHPLQYGLIGLTISVFYLLLLAISEVVGFNIAYIISSAAAIGLIVFYVQGFLGQKKFVKMILGEQVTLSAFFYVLLSLEESAFLIGTLGLFIALAIFMVITRKFDWYAGSFKSQVESQN